MKTRQTFIAMICFISMIACDGIVMAQDPHFSQHFNSPLYQNPSFTGDFPGQLRFQLNYRSQWNAVTVPFETMMAAVDMPLSPRTMKKDKIAAGITVLRDKAGDSEYGIFSAGLNLAYHLSLNRRGTHKVSFGAQAAYTQRSINYSALRFPGQFDGSAYDPGIGNGENFPLNNLGYPDIGTGINWSLSRKKNKYQLGLSLSHLNKPGLSFMENSAVRLEPRLSCQGQISFPIRENWEMIPSVQLERQDNYSKIVVGSLFRYDNPFTGSQGTSFYCGVFTRINDAAILAAGVEYSMYNFCLSYDVNYSSLHPASAYRGGFEASLAMMLHKQNKKIRREINCPVF